MKARLRTNLAVVSISSTMALLSAFFVSFGITKVARLVEVTRYPLFPALVLALGVGGIFLILSKGKALPPFIDAKIVGYLALPPLAVLLAAAVFFRTGPSIAFSLLALPCAVYAIRNAEPRPEEATHDLNDFLGAGALLLFGVLGFALPMQNPFVPPILALVAAIVVAPAALYVFRGGAKGRNASIARVAVGASLVAISVFAYLGKQPIFCVVYLPLAGTLLARPWLSGVRMGAPPPQGMTEENTVVSSFEKMAELTAWSVFIFTLFHSYLNPPGIAPALFALFIAAFCVFAVEYEMLSEKRGTYAFIQKKSIANAILLGVISHLTGGFQSPYAWFFILVLTSGGIAPDPRMILRRLYVVLGYYVIEFAYSTRSEVLNKTLIVDYLMVQLFVVGLTGVYAYRLAMRRKQIDEDLMSKNESMSKALEGEKAAKAQVVAQASKIASVKKRNEAMLESLADAVIGLKAGGGIAFMNDSAEGLLDLTTEELEGKRFRELIDLRREGDPEFRIGDYIDSALKGNAIPLPEDVYFEKNGSGKTYLSGSVVPIIDEHKRSDGAIIVLQDVSYIREVDQMKTNFLSVAAHQMRTPLSTIRWYLELLNDPTEGKLKKNQKMFAENAYLSLRKMVGLVNRLLAVTRLESGRVPFRPEPTDIKGMTKEILESLQAKLAERKLVIGVELPDLPSVPLDPTLAREVFVNLIENAIRYTPDGGTIAISASDEGDEIAWSVTDTGIGIPKAQQEKIFEKFFRAGNAVEYTSEGSGLGLYLAKFIVDAWRGRIGFDSEEGKGSTFRVTIPKAGMKAKDGHVSLNA